MELEDLMNESIKKLEGDFYNKPFNFSYSSLNKLMWSPAVFHSMYILGIKEEKQDAHLVQGKIIHGLLLEPEKFNDNFLVSPDNLPTGNPRMVIDRVFAHHQELAKNGDPRNKLTEFEGAILDVMKDMSYHQNLKTDQQRLDKIITPENINYWEFLRTKGGKTLISQEDYNFCLGAVDLIKMNPKVCSLLGLDVNDFSNKEVFNELPISVDTTTRPFGLKGIIDNLVIDHDEKILYINDVKTTSKDLRDFPETIEFYSYWMQAVIYCALVNLKFSQLAEQGYRTKFSFIVIDKMFQVYPFAVSDTTLQAWADKFKHVLDKAEWHYTNKSYDLPYEFATGSVIL